MYQKYVLILVGMTEYLENLYNPTYTRYLELHGRYLDNAKVTKRKKTEGSIDQVFEVVDYDGMTYRVRPPRYVLCTTELHRLENEIPSLYANATTGDKNIQKELHAKLAEYNNIQYYVTTLAKRQYASASTEDDARELADLNADITKIKASMKRVKTDATRKKLKMQLAEQIKAKHALEKKAKNLTVPYIGYIIKELPQIEEVQPAKKIKKIGRVSISESSSEENVEEERPKASKKTKGRKHTVSASSSSSEDSSSSGDEAPITKRKAIKKTGEVKKTERAALKKQAKPLAVHPNAQVLQKIINASNILSRLPFKTKDECTSKTRSASYYISKEELVKAISSDPQLEARFPDKSYKKMKKEDICRDLFK